MPITFRPQLCFAYDDIADDKRSIRLITLLSGEPQTPIRCRLSKHNLDSDKTQFCALSYTWGRSLEYRWIRVNGIPFFVRPNLYYALSALRKTDEDVVLWIDAICIDQTNSSERTHQVGIMSAIYSSASVVILWLGPAIAEYEPALEDMMTGEATGDLSNSLELQMSYRAIGENPYWRRAWIRQELLLAKRISVYCGTNELLWDVLQKSYRSALHFVQMWDEHTPYSDNFLATFQREVNTDAARGGIATLEELLLRYGSLECQDVRDQVYALLSLATDCQGDDPLVADYEVEPIVLFFAVLDFCQSRQLARLCRCLGRTLKLCPDEVNSIVEDPDQVRKEFQKASLLAPSGTKQLEIMRREFQHFRTHNYRGSGDQWTEVCRLCCRDFGKLDDFTPQYKLFQMSDWDGSWDRYRNESRDRDRDLDWGRKSQMKLWEDDITLVMRPALAGSILHGFLKGGTKGQTTVFDAVEEFGSSVDAEFDRFSEHRYIAKKFTKAIDLTKKDMDLVKLDIWSHGIGRVCLILQSLNDIHDGLDVRYQFDLLTCQELLKQLYGIHLTPVEYKLSEQELHRLASPNQTPWYRRVYPDDRRAETEELQKWEEAFTQE